MTASLQGAPKKKKRTFARTIALVYLSLILSGALFLTLPVCSRTGHATPFVDCLFTATSATCVTGLIVVDTASHWSLLGQLVLLLLIQTGGMGFMAIVAMFFLVLGRKMGLAQRRLLWQSTGGEDASTKTLVKSLIGCTFLCEGLGAAALSLRFIPQFGLWRGVYYSIFHAVSAFCNAGFDLFGEQAPFCSLTAYTGDASVNVIVMALITFGGLGFFVISDLVRNRLHWKKLSLHTKLVVVTSAILTFSGAILFLLFERRAALDGSTPAQRVWASMFQSVTARTAGFATVDLGRLSDAGALLMSLLMVIGGSPASTAGGLKTTTFAVVVLGVAARAHKKESVTLFRRRLEPEVVTQAWTICAIYFLIVFASTLVLCAIEPLSLTQALFEVCSAVGTVGLTMGVTPQLSLFSRMLIMVLMFAGKLGAMTLAFALVERVEPLAVQRPVDNVFIG